MTCRLTLADIDTATESPDGVGTLTFNASINLPFDNAYIGGPTVGKKRGCGTDKEKVFCALSLNSENKPLLLKLKTTKDMCQKSVAEFAKSAIKQGSTIHTDGYRSYKKASFVCYHYTAAAAKSKHPLTTLRQRCTILGKEQGSRIPG